VKPVPALQTARLRLRGWRVQDLAPLAAINADPEVMRHLGGPIERRQSDMIVARFLEKWREEPRFGWWALERAEDGAFLGFVGLGRPDFEEPPAPCVEIGWRLARGAWGQGFAAEAARACLRHGFRTVGLGEILAFTTPMNGPSRRLIERLGMQRDPGADFDHPLAAGGGRRHLLFRLARAEWEALR
jgi:RimJ/RimL family protein N-acetyltransferase